MRRGHARAGSAPRGARRARGGDQGEAAGAVEDPRGPEDHLSIISDDAASQRREAAAADAAAARRRRAPPRERRVRRGDQAPARGADERTARGDDARDGGGPRAQDARARSNDKNDGRLLAAREAAAAHASRSGVDARVAEATLEAAERRAQALDAKTRELLRALDAIEERRRVERRAREENDKAYDEDAAALGASARGRPALLADLRRVERERDARRAEAARVRNAQGTRREDPARFVSRALARYVFLKRDALVAEDEDEDEDDDESRRDPSADERAERVPSAASSASEGYGASGRVLERDERSPSRVRRLGDLNRRRRLEAARFVLDELRATLETGADVYAFGGVGGEPPRPKPKPKPKPNSKPKPNAAAKRAAGRRLRATATRRRRRRLRRVPPRARPSTPRRRRGRSRTPRAGWSGCRCSRRPRTCRPERRRAVGRAETLLKTDETESTESTESTERYGEVRARFA